MNEPEVTMPDAPTRHSLIAHDTALAARDVLSSTPAAPI